MNESRVSLYSLALEVKSVVLYGESWDRTHFSGNAFMTYTAVGNISGMYIECVKRNQVLELGAAVRVGGRRVW